MLALWRGLTGWWLRGLAALVLLAALAGPSLRQEDRTPVPSIAIVVLDDSASNRIDGRDTQLAEALEGLEARLERLGQTGGIEVHTVHVPDRGDDGTLLLTALAEATAELPPDRIAGAILVAAGGPATAWARNLLADPGCRVELADRSFPAVAEPLEPAEHSAAIRALILRYGTPAEGLGHGPSFRLRPVGAPGS